MSEHAEPPAPKDAKPAEDAKNPPGENPEETAPESRISAARSDPLAEARSTSDAVAVSQAYQSFQRSVSAAGPVGVVGGATISGGLHVYAAGPAPAAATSGPVRADLLDDIVSWYAAAPQDAELRSTLRERRLVVLGGARGSGRSTTALKLLAEFTPGGVKRLPPLSGPIEAVTAHLDPRHGYLGELRTVDQPPNEADLDRLAACLQERDAYCVLILPADDIGATAGVYLRNHITPPRFSVLNQRTKAFCSKSPFTAPEARTRLTALSRDPDLRALLGAAPDPSDEVWLAELVKRLAAGEIDREAAMGSAVDLVDRHIGAWLADLPQGVDLYRHRDQVGVFAFRLALAVLNDSPADLVAEAGERLAWELYTTANPRITPGRTVFARVDEGWLAGSRAALRDGSVIVADAAVPARLLSFQDDRLAVRLLAGVWGSRPNLRRPILRWLQDLSQDRRPVVWTRAALAIGLVAGWDFAYSYHEAIEAWAGSEIPKQRLVAATALDQAARDRSTGAAVGNLLKGWAKSGDEALMWTAAAVLGYGAGASDATAALRMLRRIGTWEGGELAGIASDCAAELLTRGRFDEVLAAADAWIGDPRVDEHFLGLLTVIRLGDLRVRQLPGVAELPLGAEARSALEEPGRAGWPLVVALAQYSERVGALLADCVWQVLSSASAADVMRDGIGDWIRAAGSSSDLLDPLIRFLRRVIDDEDDEARLLDLVEVLAADPDEPIPPGTAHALRTAIKDGWMPPNPQITGRKVRGQ